MSIRKITSTANPQIKQLRLLASSKKERREAGVFLVEGWRALDSLFTHPSDRFQVERLVVTPEWVEDPRLPADIEIIEVPAFVFEKISEVRSAQGILGVVRGGLYSFNPEQAHGNYLLLDSIRDPGNLGTLIRSAAGAGFSGVLLYGDCADPFAPKVVRSSMGMFAFVEVATVDDAGVDALLSAGYTLCATTGSEGENLYQAQFGDKNLLAIGSEAHGLCETLFQRAARKITIPLEPECESLNAAVAGSICLFQIQRGA